MWLKQLYSINFKHTHSIAVETMQIVQMKIEEQKKKENQPCENKKKIELNKIGFKL